MPEWMSPSKERTWPNLTRAVYCKTSDPDKFNNCAGWAANDKGWWQPPSASWHYWPPSAPLDYSVKAFVRAYELSGFEICSDDSYEDGYEKIALYGWSWGEFAHAAKRNDDGSWSSKLGKWEDIRHETLTALEGMRPAYGRAETFMKRKIANAETTKS